MHRKLNSILLGAAMVLPLATAGCAHHYYYVDDPYYHDSHRWDKDERSHYQQWVIENHIGPGRDYQHLSNDEQKRYWDWRHHGDHDHDKH